MTARVRGVIASVSVRGVMSSVSSLTSAKRGSGACPDHGGGGGDERVRGHHDLVARADAEGGQAELQGVRSVGDTDRMSRAAVGGPLALEGRDRGTADVPSVQQAGHVVRLDRPARPHWPWRPGR